MLTNDIFWASIENISLLIVWLCFYVVVDEFNEKKKGKLTIVVSFLVVVIISMMLRGLNIDAYKRIIICFFIGFVFYKFNFKCNNIKCVMISLMFWLFTLTMEVLSISFVVKVNGLSSVAELLHQNMYRLENLLLYKVFLVSLIIIVKCLKLRVDIGKSESLYMIIPIVTNIIMILVIFGYVFSDDRSIVENNISIFFISIMLLLSNMSLMFIASKIIKNNKLKLENEFIKNKLKMDYKYYSDMQVNQEKVKRLYHDMKNHIVCIEEAGTYDTKLKNDYLESINKELDKLNVSFDTGNEVLDVILNNKRELCNSNNIDFQVVIDFSKIEFIEYFDICTIFSNSLDNAIEACKKMNKDKKRFISLKGTCVKNFYIIKVENSKTNKVKHLNGDFLTDKRNKFLHGLGLKNIRLAIEEYSGEMTVETSDDKFTLKILIPIKGE